MNLWKTLCWALMCACVLTSLTMAQTSNSTDDPTIASDRTTVDGGGDTTTVDGGGDTTTESGGEVTTVTSVVMSTTEKSPADREDGSWNVTDPDTDHVCILIKMSACFNIKYMAKGNIKKIGKICIPKSATVGSESNCGNDTNVLQLKFGCNSLTMNFVEESNKVHVDSGKFVYRLKPDIFHDPLDKSEIRVANFSDVKLFSVPALRSFKCAHEESMKLTEDVTMVTKDVQLEAFRKVKTSVFSSPSLCKDDRQLNYLLPIICSVVLGSIVVVILIVYGIARVRISRKSYTDLKS